MSFSSQQTIPSEIFPGVCFTIKRIGLGPRTEIDKKTLPYRQRLRELEQEYPAQTPREEELSEQLDLARQKLAILEDGESKPLPGVLEQARADVKQIARDLIAAAPADVRKKRKVLDEEYATVQGPIRLVWIREGLISIAGGDVDGMTAEQLLDYGPPALAQEMYEHLTGEGRLAGPQAKNSSSPGTSGAPGDQATSNTTAEPAGEKAGTDSETASDTSRLVSIPG